jgi:hypothetical protein
MNLKMFLVMSASAVATIFALGFKNHAVEPVYQAPAPRPEAASLCVLQWGDGDLVIPPSDATDDEVYVHLPSPNEFWPADGHHYVPCKWLKREALT